MVTMYLSIHFDDYNGESKCKQVELVDGIADALEVARVVGKVLMMTDANLTDSMTARIDESPDYTAEIIGCHRMMSGLFLFKLDALEVSQILEQVVRNIPN